MRVDDTGEGWLGKSVTGKVVDWKRGAGALVLVVEVDASVVCEVEVRCREGHDLTEVNAVSLSKEGYARCKTCRRLADALRRRHASGG